jgi:hypothetical protein
MRRLHDRSGFALPVTLFVVAIVTVMLSAVFVQVRMDRRISESSGDIVDALTVAQSGLQTYLGMTSFDACERAIRPLDGDSVRINVQGGYADVVAHVTQKPADTLSSWLYVVRSTGHVILPTAGEDPQAQRTVAQFARWQRNSLNVLAAWTAANGLETAGLVSAPVGNTGELKGADQAPSGCKDPNVYSLRVPSGAAPTWPPTGYTLNGLSPYMLASGSKSGVADETLIDWEAVTSGGIVPDYDYMRFWDTDYPVMLVESAKLDVMSCGTGYGLLIVTGDLDFNGTGSPCYQWYGVIIVGGEIEWDASDQRVDGAVISGMKRQVSEWTDEGDVDGNSNGAYLDIDYDSRYVRLALKSLAGFAPVGNAWVDNWATY